MYNVHDINIQFFLFFNAIQLTEKCNNLIILSGLLSRITGTAELLITLANQKCCKYVAFS